MTTNSKTRTSPANDTIAAAVKATPGATVADLADATGLGKSTISKILATLEANGTTRREPGGRDGARRLPDRWHPTKPTPAPAPTRRSRTTHRDNGQASPATERLAKGQLGTLVLDHLAAHPSAEFGPTAIGNALDRSQGAVANALARLATSGQAELTSAKPRRYRLAHPTK